MVQKVQMIQDKGLDIILYRTVQLMILIFDSGYQKYQGFQMHIKMSIYIEILCEL